MHKYQFNTSLVICISSLKVIFFWVVYCEDVACICKNAKKSRNKRPCIYHKIEIQEWTSRLSWKLNKNSHVVILQGPRNILPCFEFDNVVRNGSKGVDTFSLKFKMWSAYKCLIKKYEIKIIVSILKI